MSKAQPEGGPERFPVEWNRERFHSTGKARYGNADCTGHIPFG